MPFPLLALLALTGAGSSIVGRILGTVAENEQAEAEQRRLRVLAEINRRIAGQVRRNANEEAGRVITQGSQQASQIKVGFAAGGIDPTAGTTAANIADAEVWAHGDALRVQLNAAMKARGYDQQASDALAQAKGIGEQRKLANIGAAIGIAGQALGAAASFGQQFPDAFGSGLSAAGAAPETPAPAASASQGLSVSHEPALFDQALEHVRFGKLSRYDQIGSVMAKYGGAPSASPGGRKLWSDLWE